MISTNGAGSVADLVVGSLSCAVLVVKPGDTGEVRLTSEKF